MISPVGEGRKGEHSDLISTKCGADRVTLTVKAKKAALGGESTTEMVILAQRYQKS